MNNELSLRNQTSSDKHISRQASKITCKKLKGLLNWNVVLRISITLNIVFSGIWYFMSLWELLNDTSYK